MDMAMSPPCRPCSSPSSPLHSPPWPPCHSSPPLSPTPPSIGQIDRNAVTTPHHARPAQPRAMPRASCARHGHPQSTRRPIPLRLPWTTAEHLELRRRHANPPDTDPCPRAACRRRPARHFPAPVPPVLVIALAQQPVPHLAL